MTELFQPFRMLRVHPLDAAVVALAVRVSGGDPERATLLSLAAVRFQGGTVTGTFEVKRSEIAGGRLRGLVSFIGESPVVGYDIAFAAAVLARHGAPLGLVQWDAGELAGLLMPAASGATLPSLARILLPDAMPASNLAEESDLVRRMYAALVDRVKAEPAGVLRRMAGLLARAQSPLAELVSALADDATASGPIGGLDLREVSARLERPRPIGSPRPPEPLDPDEITHLLSGNGPFARRFPRYEPRLEQIAMARAVALALGSREHGGLPHHLVVEGGTGIGKSVAYLLPAILFAVRNNVRVVVSTNTINLQAQLMSKDIPDLLEVLSEVFGLDLSHFHYAQMKGKANYLCLRRWETQANSDAVSPDDARLLARTLNWLRETRTGDRGELALRGREFSAWDRISAGNFALCNGAREGVCFYRHARDEAAAAHLLVVNHSLLLSDLQVDGSVLPPYDYLIVDEAHNLEEEATRQFGFRVTQSTVEDLVERLGEAVHALGASLKVSIFEAARAESLHRRMEEAQLPLYRVRDTWAQLAAGLTAFAAAERGETSDEGELRITPALRGQPAWSELEIAWDNFETAASEAARRGEALWKELEGLSADAMPGLEDIRGTVAEWLADQAEVRGHVAGFVSAPEETMVYWIGKGGGPLSLNGAPLEVGPRLQEELFDAKECVVLTSATLTVRGGFQHVRQRLGVGEAEELCLGSPFDYRKAALLCLPTDVPEPTTPRYADAVADIVGRLALDAAGRTMALFTSHASVRATAAALRRSLSGKGISVLAQALDGTPQQVLARFQEDPRAVLLGTASFWEGVDITDNALKVLVVARLPFNVPTEPVFAARSGLYESPFMDYAVPQAVLRFRQGFGRLIRNKNDHGAVVVLDSRMTSKSYGKVFLTSLPPATTLRAPMAQVFPVVRDWLATPAQTP